MDFLKSKIKKYNKYVIEIENDAIKANNFENIEDAVIISKEDFEKESQKSRELMAKLKSIELEVQLKGLKLQEKELEVQKSESKIAEIEETHASKLKELERRNITERSEFKQLLEKEKAQIETIEKENLKIRSELGNKVKLLENRLKEEKKQMKVYKIGNNGLKNEINVKEEEIETLKKEYNNKLLDLKSAYEKEIKALHSDIDGLEEVQTDYNKLGNSYRHLQEVLNKKDRVISELESEKRRLEQLLAMSSEAITAMRNLGLFERLLNRIPDDIEELQEDIKRLQPPKEIEIEPVRIRSTADVLGDKL